MRTLLPAINISKPLLLRGKGLVIFCCTLFLIGVACGVFQALHTGIRIGNFHLAMAFDSDPSSSQPFFTHQPWEHTNDGDLHLGRTITFLIPGGDLTLNFERTRSREKARAQLPTSIEGLIKSLSLEDRWLAFCAAELLSEKEAAAVSALPHIIHLADRIPATLYFIDPISRAAPTAAVPALINGMHEYPKFQRQLTRMLGALGTNALPALSLLQQKFSQDTFTQVPVTALAIFQISGQCDDLLPPLLRQLSSTSDSELQRRIIFVLGQFGPCASSTVTNILPFLDKSNGPRLQETVIAALGRIRSQPEIALPPILEYLQEHNRADYNNSTAIGIRALTDFGEPAVPHLLTLYHSTNFLLRTAAITAFKKLGPAAAPALQTLIDDLHTSRPVRIIRACEIIATMGETANPALPQLRALLGFPDTRVKIHAATTLCKLQADPEEYLSTLIAILDDRTISSETMEIAVTGLFDLLESNPEIKDKVTALLQNHPLATSRVNHRKRMFPQTTS